jgi:hypothetical protein
MFKLTTRMISIVVLSGFASAEPGIQVTTVARPGQAVPDLPGLLIAGQGGSASINDSGEMLYAVRISGDGVTSGNNDVLLMKTTTNSLLIARERDPVLNMPGFIHLPASINLSGVSNLVVASDGTIGYIAQVWDSGAVIDTAAISGVPGSSWPFLWTTGPAPSFPGETITQYRPDAPIMSGGLVLFQGRVSSGVDAIWLGSTPGPVTTVLQTGLQAPGLPIGVNIQSFSSGSMRMNAQGHIALGVVLPLGNGVDQSNRRVLYEGLPDQLGVLARSGDPVEGFPQATWTIFDQDTLRMNAAGALCYAGIVSGGGTDEVIVTRGNGTSALLVKDGDPVPGLPGMTFDRVSRTRVDINGQGKVAFSCSIAGAPFDANSGIFIGDPNGIEMVLREGDTLPDGSVVGDLAGATWVFNDRNQFVINLGASGVSSIVATRPNGEVVILAKAAQFFQTDDGFAGIVHSTVPWALNFTAGAGGSGESVVFNNSGQLVLPMNFSGATGSGIFLFDIDDPCIPDFVEDGVLDFFDISSFLQLFSQQDPAADINDDGLFDFFDVSQYLALFAAGC